MRRVESRVPPPKRSSDFPAARSVRASARGSSSRQRPLPALPSEPRIFSWSLLVSASSSSRPQVVWKGTSQSMTSSIQTASLLPTAAQRASLFSKHQTFCGAPSSRNSAEPQGGRKARNSRSYPERGDTRSRAAPGPVQHSRSAHPMHGARAPQLLERNHHRTDVSKDRFSSTASHRFVPCLRIPSVLGRASPVLREAPASLVSV